MSNNTKAITGGRWEATAVLRAARARMRELVNKNSALIQTMLADLLKEAGWSEQDFLDALVRDISENGKDRWQVPTPSLARALPRSLEGERRPPSRSGTQARVGAGSYSHVVPRSKKAAR